MAETAIEDLLDIVRDPASGMRNRLSAAVAASRTSRLAMPGEQVPEAVMFLREIVGTEREGSRFKVEYRREAATALSYYERRCKKAELTYEVPDQAERRESWRRLGNSAFRAGHWPQEGALLGPDIEVPPGDPERALAAVLLPPIHGQSARRQRAVDDPGGAGPIATEAERLALIRSIVDLVERRG